MITGCIIQGNIRTNTLIIVEKLINQFDYIIISTWEDEKFTLNKYDNLFILKSIPPLSPGFSNRNFQRYSTAIGIKKARELNCEYILKWRTDMLPFNLNINELFNYSQFNIPKGFKSRIVTCAFRNLTVYDDWFSSMPDLFSFGHIDTMELLWGDYGFDYTKMMNPPAQMLLDEGEEWMNRADVSGYWCAESELYAILKDRLQKKLDIKLSHEEIAKNYMRLFDHDKLSIVWFGENGKFRPIFQAWQIPWWSESNWMGEKQIKYASKGYNVQNYFSLFREKFNWLIKLKELRAQYKYYKGFIGGKN